MYAHMLTTPGKKQAPPETPALFAHWGWVKGLSKPCISEEKGIQQYKLNIS